MATKKATAKKAGGRMVLVGNASYGLYIGMCNVPDAQIVKEKAARLTQVRHVARWFGKTGGITSLAAHGPCGPRVGESRIGAPAPTALLTGIVNVIDLTPEAVAAFAAIVPQ